MKNDHIPAKMADVPRMMDRRIVRRRMNIGIGAWDETEVRFDLGSRLDLAGFGWLAYWR